MFTKSDVPGFVPDFQLSMGENTYSSYRLGTSSDIVLHLASLLSKNQSLNTFSVETREL